MAVEIEQTTEQIEKLKARLDTIEIELNQKELGEIKIEVIASFLERFSEFFKEWDIFQRKLLIQTVVNKVIVYSKDKIKIILSIPISKGNKLIDLSIPKETPLPSSPVAEKLPVTSLVSSGVPPLFAEGKPLLFMQGYYKCNILQYQGIWGSREGIPRGFLEA